MYPSFSLLFYSPPFFLNGSSASSSSSSRRMKSLASKSNPIIHNLLESSLSLLHKCPSLFWPR